MAAQDECFFGLARQGRPAVASRIKMMLDGEIADYRLKPAAGLEPGRAPGEALGSVQSPNSSFRSDSAQKDLSPVGRWRKLVSPTELAQLESVLGDLLEQVGYQCESRSTQRTPTLAVRLMSVLYPAFWDLKLWLKSSTPLARIADIQRMGVRERLGEGQ